MANNFNTRGTTFPSFTIGKNGPTIRQSATDFPDATVSLPGDIWVVQNGTDAGLYQFTSGSSWNLTVSIDTTNTANRSLTIDSIVLGNPIGGNLGAGTINAEVGMFINGTAVGTGGGGATSLAALSDVLLASPINMNILVYNGAKWTNQPTGTASGIQNWSANLDTISGLAQGTGEVIISNGTSWVSRKSTITNDLSDVDITSPNTNDILTYNGTIWVNGTATGGALTTLTDVTITTPINNQVLSYNGTKWVNATSPAGVTTLSGLSDVSIITPASGNIFFYNGTVWINGTTGASSGIQPFDSTILKSSNIGSTVEAFDATILKSAAIGVSVEAFDATILKSAAIGTTIQAHGANLDTISALSQGTANVIRSNGTVWQSSKLDFNTDLTNVAITTPTNGQVLTYNGTSWINGTNSGGTASLATLTDVALTGLASGNVLYYNGTKWVNGTKGSTSGVQAWNGNLDDIAAISQSVGSIIVSNGTHYISQSGDTARHTLGLGTVDAVQFTTIKIGDTTSKSLSGEYTARNTTTTNATTELFLDGTSSRLTLSNFTSWLFNIRIIGRRTDSNDQVASFVIDGTIDRESGAATTVLINDPSIVSNTGILPWTASISADTSNGALKIQVAGENGKTIKWVAFIRTVEITN